MLIRQHNGVHATVGDDVAERLIATGAWEAVGEKPKPKPKPAKKAAPKAPARAKTPPKRNFAVEVE